MVTIPADLLPKTQRPSKIQLRISPSYCEKPYERRANESQQERIHWLQKACPSKSDKQGQNQLDQTGHQPVLANCGSVDTEVRSDLLELPVPLELRYVPSYLRPDLFHPARKTGSLLLLCYHASNLLYGVHPDVRNENFQSQ